MFLLVTSTTTSSSSPQIDWPLLISVIALLISIISIWMTTISPFRLKISKGSPRFRLYPIKGEGKIVRWMPSFDFGLSLHNLGSRPGEIKAIRFFGELQDKKSKREFSANPKWIVDYAKFNENPKRFDWVEKAVLQHNWIPIILRGQSDLSLHLILEPFGIDSSWDRPFSAKLSFHLEVLTSKGIQKVGNYYFEVDESMFEQDDWHNIRDEDEKIPWEAW